MTEPLRRREASIISPLRYPWAKRRLAGYLAEVLRLNSLRPKLFVEPFAGGASVSLRLLNDGIVDRIALGERDPLIASFWKIVFEDSEWLVEQIETIPVTVEQWRRFRADRLRSHRDRALACIFLNRTSFSGILAPGAGPLGGYDQDSEYTIDCRFTVKTIAKRIRQAASLREKVAFVTSADWQETIRKAETMGYRQGEVFYYFDPPFYRKAERLYRFCFGQEDHTRLHDAVVGLNQPWLLSYDPARPIVDLYSHNGRGPKRVDLLYTAAAAPNLVEAQELVITNQPRLPKETRLWRSSEEWSTPSAPATHRPRSRRNPECRGGR